MKKFFVLYMAPTAEIDKMMQSMSKADGEKAMEDWQKWMDDHKESIVDMGAMLGKNKRVTKDGVADVRNEATGYSIIQANSHEEAANLFKDQPHFGVPGSYIEVISMTEIPKK